MIRPHLLSLGAVLLWATGCASAPAEPAPSGQRVMLTLGRALPFEPEGIAAFEARASRSAGATVRYVAGVSSLVHVVDLRCDSAASCEAALTRLRADAPYITDARIDVRRRPSGT